MHFDGHLHLLMGEIPTYKDIHKYGLKTSKGLH